MTSDRNYMIFPVSELNKIDFSQVMETSVDTVRKSVDGTKTFVKYEAELPECFNDVLNTEGPYTSEEMKEILTTLEWTVPNALVINNEYDYVKDYFLTICDTASTAENLTAEFLRMAIQNNLSPVDLLNKLQNNGSN